MPILCVFTNLPKDKIPQDFLSKATEMLSKQINKPSKYITISVHPDTIMSHAGTNDPCCSIQLSSIGKLGQDVNKDHSQKIGSFITETLGIPMDRFYIKFDSLEPFNVGYNGSTF
ncbi:macrophage migration inhibitory factor-like [Argonauta hians]